jgi:predicted transcriptional regulator
MVKLTFSLDDETVATLRTTALRLRKPQSMVVREAIAHYASQEDLTSPAERERILKTIAEIKRLPPTGSREDAVREIEQITRARHASGLHRNKRLKEATQRAARGR